VKRQLFAASGEPGSRPGPEPLRIVIAEDDRDSAATLEALLNDEGHQTRCVHHGRDVVGTVGQFGSDVVILDIGMPGMTGYEVARELRARYGSAKPILVAVTASGKAADKLMAKNAGIDFHVSKPYDPRQLLALIKKIAEANRPQ
jgi:CheY-like chemotaxis protein